MRDPKLRTLEVVVLAQTPVLVIVEYLNLAAGKWLLAALVAIPLLLSLLGCGVILAAWLDPKPRD